MKLTDVRIGKRLMICFGFASVLMLAVGVVGLKALSDVAGEWDAFQRITLRKTITAAEADSALGDGIQNFKNYLLRGQSYHQKFAEDMEKIEKAVKDYAATGRLAS